MEQNWLTRVLSVGENRPAQKYQKIVKSVVALDGAYSDLSDTELAGMTKEFRERLENGEKLEGILPEAFAVVREAADRTLNQKPYPVQILGGIALFKGNVAQMKTGEGKTLVATMPAYLEALSGRGVHVVTVNEYLAKYQSEQMGRVFRALGMTTGCVLSDQDTLTKQENYNCDITYGTSSEFGFDYLRDHMLEDMSDTVHRQLNYAIIDEIDSILMDEANTPLVISSPGDPEAGRDLQRMAQAVRGLKEGEDYKTELKEQAMSIHEPGVQKVEASLGIDNIFSGENAKLVGLMYSAAKAKAMFERDKDYIVRNGEIEIVDKETGRVLEGRRFNEGLHQAIEAKEGIKTKPEDVTAASITLQSFFKLYGKLSGMTGTAKSESGELTSLYKLRTIEVPTNKPMIRVDKPTRYFRSEQEKITAVIEEVKTIHASGQPILIGTGSVAKSERFSRALKDAGLPHNVLNAKDISREASIVAEAGQRGTITVSTNMAGRGTDIILGGNPEALAADALHARGLDAYQHSEEYEKAWSELYPKLVADAEKAGLEVAELGGLFVIGTERHESKRIDDQLRGRAGRQGDPGASQFFCSLEDELMQKYKPKDLPSMKALAASESGELPYAKLDSFFNRIQTEASQLNRGTRTEMQKYDAIIDLARRHVYKQREVAITQDTDYYKIVDDMRQKVVSRFVDERIEGAPTDEEASVFMNELASLYPSTITVDDILEEMQYMRTPDANWLKDELLSDSEIVLQKALERLGESTFNKATSEILIETIDEKWAEYLAYMEMFMDGLNFYAMAQQEPELVYRTAANDQMKRVQEAIEESLVREMLYLSVGDIQYDPGYEIENLKNSAKKKVTGKKQKPTPKRKRNNSAITQQIAFESGLIGREEAELQEEQDFQPMNRAERRAAAKNNRKKGKQ